jgi:dienelactone hydrolase
MLIVLCLGATFATGCLQAAQRTVGSCNPFGDAPAARIKAVKPNCGSGELLGPWKDADGTARYACAFYPQPSPDGRLAMLVYLNPSLFPVSTITFTNLLAFQHSSLLNGKGASGGFIVLAPEARMITHHYPFPEQYGIGWDVWYRQFDPRGDVAIGARTYQENVDAATIDHFIASEVASGRVDPSRIYITGWSNGAAMAFLYGLNRPGIAAASAYSAFDPFGALNDACQQTPVAHAPQDGSQVRIFNPRLPVMHIYRSCDIDGLCPNAEKFARQLRNASIAVDDVIVDGAGGRVQTCDPHCGTDPNGGLSAALHLYPWLEGLRNHMRWPAKWTHAMLNFLGERRSSMRRALQF